MSSLSTYNGLQVLTPEPSVSAGKAINDNFKALSTKLNTQDPSSSDDETLFYSAGSRWFNTTVGAEWICVDATAGNAVWRNLSNFLPISGGALTGPLNVSGTVTATGTITANSFAGDGSQLTGITATQVGALPTSGGTLTGSLSAPHLTATVDINSPAIYVDGNSVLTTAAYNTPSGIPQLDAGGNLSGTTIQISRNTAANIAATVLLQGQLAYTTDTKTVYVGDGTTAGGKSVQPDYSTSGPVFESTIDLSTTTGFAVFQFGSDPNTFFAGFPMMCYYDPAGQYGTVSFSYDPPQYHASIGDCLDFMCSALRATTITARDLHDSTSPYSILIGRCEFVELITNASEGGTYTVAASSDSNCITLTGTGALTSYTVKLPNALNSSCYEQFSIICRLPGVTNLAVQNPNGTTIGTYSISQWQKITFVATSSVTYVKLTAI